MKINELFKNLINLLPARDKIVIPISNTQMGEKIAGFSQNSDDLSQGKMHIESTNERILIGDATEVTTGAGIFAGKVISSDTAYYSFRVGDPLGQYMYYNGITGALTLTAALSASTIDIGTGFHVDTSGNVWWGSSTTYAGATIKISSAGSINLTTGTFSGSITGATGTFSGDLSASSINIANSWRVNSVGDMWWGNYASYASAILDNGNCISSAGLINFTTGDFSGTVTGATITGGTITGGTIQTDTGLTGHYQRVVISGSTNDIAFYNSSNVLQCTLEAGGNFFTLTGLNGCGITVFGDGHYIALKGSDGTNSCRLNVFDNYFEVLRDTVAEGTISLLAINATTKATTLNGTFYAVGNIATDGTVDGVDVAAHAHGGAGAGGTIAHGSLSGVNADSHHSSTSDGLAITPSTCVASGTGTGTGSSIYGYNLGLSNGSIYNGNTASFYIGGNNSISYFPMQIGTRSGTPGNATDWDYYLYYDTAQSTFVFSNGTDWYKVDATKIV